jgi:hypothetical protein
VLAVSMPVAMPPALDQLAIAGMVAAALAFLAGWSPSVRGALTLRRPTLADLGWTVVALDASLLGVLLVGAPAAPRTAVELQAVAVLVLLAPALQELTLRGLLVHPADRPSRQVLPAALVQGFVASSLFGWSGLVAGVLLGIVLGAVAVRGGWQRSLFVHWGLALGVAAPVLAVAR